MIVSRFTLWIYLLILTSFRVTVIAQPRRPTPRPTHPPSGYVYNGTECAGVYQDFNLSLPSMESFIDTATFGIMNLTFYEAPWIEAACVRRIRMQVCMQLLQTQTNTSAGFIILTSDQQPYCQSTCFAIDEEGCGAMMSISPPVITDLLLSGCFQLPPDQPGCHNGNLSTVVERDPICPNPLVIPDSDSFKSPAKIEMVYGTACAIPCPGLLFNKKNWHIFSTIAFVLYCFSTVAVGTATYDNYLRRKTNFNILMVCLGCLNASFWMMIYHGVNYGTDAEQAVICKGNSGYVSSDSFCVFCGFMLLTSCNWYACWSFFIAFQLWLSVTRKYSQIKLRAMRNSMIMIAAFFTILPVAPLIAGNIGYEWTGGTLNMCLNKGTYTRGYVGHQEWHIVVTTMPLSLLAFFLPLVLLLDVLRVVSQLKRVTSNNSSIVTTSTNLSTSKSYFSTTCFENLSELFTKNKKIFKFIFYFEVLTGLFVACDLYTAFGEDLVANMTAAIECILINASPDPSYGQTQCPSTYEGPHEWTTYVLILYTAGFCCFPFMVFYEFKVVLPANIALTSSKNETSSYENDSNPIYTASTEQERENNIGVGDIDVGEQGRSSGMKSLAALRSSDVQLVEVRGSSFMSNRTFS